LFQPARRFDTESFFLKQPVAEASINSELLTLRVPVNGAKSDGLLSSTLSYGANWSRNSQAILLKFD